MPTNTTPEVESADTMAERIVSELSDDPRDEDFWTTVQGLAHAIGKRDSAVRRAALLEARLVCDEELCSRCSIRLHTLAEKAAP